MDYRDGSQKWEQFLIGPFLDHLRKEYRLIPDRNGTLLFGISMGGMGSLRLGFKYPDLFAALAALEPGIEPALAFKDIKVEDRFWRSMNCLKRFLGNRLTKPIGKGITRPISPWKTEKRLFNPIWDLYRMRGWRFLRTGPGDRISASTSRGQPDLHEYHLVKGRTIWAEVWTPFGRRAGFSRQDAESACPGSGGWKSTQDDCPVETNVERSKGIGISWKNPGGKNLKFFPDRWSKGGQGLLGSRFKGLFFKDFTIAGNLLSPPPTKTDSLALSYSPYDKCRRIFLQFAWKSLIEYAFPYFLR